MRYRAEMQLASNMDEDDFAMWVEDVLYAATINTEIDLLDLSVYELTHLPGWGYSD